MTTVQTEIILVIQYYILTQWQVFVQSKVIAQVNKCKKI